jgi:glycosyltransferase involved in cell wall biosynthesis
MKRVLLIHQNQIEHYRIPVYNFLSQYMNKKGYLLYIVSNRIEKKSPHEATFKFIETKLNIVNNYKLLNKLKPDAVILYIDLKHLYLFPTLLLMKFKKMKTIYWNHGINLENKKTIKNYFYYFQHSIVDAILLYAHTLKKYIKKNNHHKTFIANNTLNTTIYKSTQINKRLILSKYGIKHKKNIICIGRIQKRKRIDDLIKAFKLIHCEDVGLILVGPDVDGILKNITEKNMYKLEAIYGEETIQLLSACDVYCLPGHVGLSIVDSFFCGLPIVTEDVSHAPEIVYFKNGINGFMVEKGNVVDLAKKLELLINNDELRKKFSISAKKEIQKNGHIKTMSNGFIEALDYIFYEKKQDFIEEKL